MAGRKKKEEPEEPPDIDSRIESSLSELAKMFGPGAIGTLKGKHALGLDDVDSISTGSLKIDAALGVRGIPRGRIVEVFGAESSGKTTLCLQTLANAQRQYPDELTAFIDAEHAIDPRYAEALGVNLERMLVIQPDSGESALDAALQLTKLGNVSAIVIDSVAALVPQAELEGTMTDNHVGRQARMMGQALRMITGPAAAKNTAVIFINQLREKVGVMFGSPKVTPGGKALKFYASQRIELVRIGSVKIGDEKIGNKVKIDVRKNKLAPPFQIVETELTFGKGFNRSAELLDLGVALKILKKSGSYYKFGDDTLGQGRTVAQHALMSNPELVEQIEQEFWKAESDAV